MALAFSAQTTANQCRDFIDDLNVPFKETYGAQPPIGILRQMFILTAVRTRLVRPQGLGLPPVGGPPRGSESARVRRLCALGAECAGLEKREVLLEVQQAMIRCLTETTGRSFLACAGGDCATWVLEWPAQCVIAVDNVYWTKEVAAAIEEGKLDEYHKKCIQQLLGIVVLVCGGLSKLARQTLSAVVTVDVHNSEVIQQLKDSKVTFSRAADGQGRPGGRHSPGGQADGTLHIPGGQHCKPINCGAAPAVAHATVHGGTIFGALMDATRRTRQAGSRSDDGKPAVALNHAGGHDDALQFSEQHPRTWDLKPRSGSQDDQKESYHIGAFQFSDRHPRTWDLKPRSGSLDDQKAIYNIAEVFMLLGYGYLPGSSTTE